MLIFSKAIDIGDTYLDFVDKYKYLGITLDKHMNLTSLIPDVKKNVLSHLLKLRKLLSSITTFCAILIFIPRCAAETKGAHCDFIA